MTFVQKLWLALVTLLVGYLLIIVPYWIKGLWESEIDTRKILLTVQREMSRKYLPMHIRLESVTNTTATGHNIQTRINAGFGPDYEVLTNADGQLYVRIRE